MTLTHLCTCGTKLTRPGNCGCRDKTRGTTSQRGYGTAHQKLRRTWLHRISTENIHCSRCDKPINPNDNWDLDHTNDRTGYNGPAHAHCNRGATPRFFENAIPDPSAAIRETHEAVASGPSIG